MFSLPTGADPITLYHVQLPCPTSGGQFPVSFESRECKPRDVKRFYLSILTHRELENVWRTIWALSQGAEGQLVWCRVIWAPGDKEYGLKHYIKDPEIPLAAISLGNSFAVEETIAPSRSPGWFVTVGSPDHFPTGCFSPKENRAEIISLEVGKERRKEGRKGRILLRTQFFYPHKGLEAWKAWRPVLWCFTVGILLLSPRWNFCSAPSQKTLEFGIFEEVWAFRSSIHG